MKNLLTATGEKATPKIYHLIADTVRIELPCLPDFASGHWQQESTSEISSQSGKPVEAR